MTMQPDLVIYHGPSCLDGFTAAWAIWRRWPKASFLAANYGDEPPDVTGLNVLIVDFSYKAAVLAAMAERAHTITIVDHHKTAAEDLAPYATARISDLASFDELARIPTRTHVQAVFNMEKSGARLAWEYAFPEREIVPNIVRFVEDRDLWRFTMPETRDACALLYSHDFSFDLWDQLADDLQFPPTLASLLTAGSAIERQKQKDARAIVSACAREMIFDGHRVPVANCPYYLASDVGNIMAQGKPFAATYYDSKDGQRHFSLRSGSDGLDVSAIAAKLGGGGHKHAAGCTDAPCWPAAPLTHQTTRDWI